MIRTLLLCLLFPLFACQAQQETTSAFEQAMSTADTTQTDVARYAQQHPDNGQPSKSVGTPGNGSLENGKLMPFSGSNFLYFDALSYCNGRAFAHSAVKATVLDAYKILESELPGRQFGLMECSHQHGGQLKPHRTHQNGLSVDFMMPLVKNGQPYNRLDSIGAAHYLLDFDNEGRYTRDATISIDFDVLAQHILALDKAARSNGLKIAKVIIKIELKDELFATAHGKRLKNSGIYVVQSLSPLVNSLHDEHFHIDFEPL